MRSTSDCLKIAKAASCSEVHPLSRTKRVAMSAARKRRFCRRFSLSGLVSHSRFNQSKNIDTQLYFAWEPCASLRKPRPVYTFSSNRTAWNKLTEAGLQRILTRFRRHSRYSNSKNRRERKSWKHRHKPLTLRPSACRTRINQHPWAAPQSSGSSYWLAS